MLSWLRDLDPTTRRNFVLELLFGIGTGVLSGLILVAQVVAVGSLGDKSQSATMMVAAQPALALLLPLWAMVARHYRLFDLVLIGGTLRALPLLAVGWIDQPWQLAIVVVLYYLLGGPATLAIPALYKYAYPDKHRGKIIGILKMVQNGITVPVLIGVSLWSDIEPTAYQLAYPIGGCLGLLGVIAYQFRRIPSDNPQARRTLSESPSWSGMQHVLKIDRQFRLFQATIFLTGAGFLLSRGVWLYLLRDHFHLSQFFITLLVMIFPVILGGITSPFWGWLIDKTSPVAGRIAFALMGIPAYLALFASFYLDWLILAFIGAAFRGVVLGAAEVATTTGNLYFAEKPERAALYESISSVFQGIRGMSMPPLGWALYQSLLVLGWTTSLVFLIPMVFNGWSLWIAWGLWKDEQQERHCEAKEHELPIEVDE
ncbi:MAG TPA: MFS transporter [Gemmatales bacterium]|nr:MFS transporter [Gemmatales bacterium]